MTTSKIAISVDQDLLVELDHLVATKMFSSRSQAIRLAVQEKLARINRNRLAQESAKLNPAFEQTMAEEGMSGELAQWPEY